MQREAGIVALEMGGEITDRVEQQTGGRKLAVSRCVEATDLGGRVGRHMPSECLSRLVQLNQVRGGLFSGKGQPGSGRCLRIVRGVVLLYSRVGVMAGQVSSMCGRVSLVGSRVGVVGEVRGGGCPNSSLFGWNLFGGALFEYALFCFFNYCGDFAIE